MKTVRLTELQRVFDHRAILDAVEQALISQAAGEVQSPLPGQLLFDDPPGDCHVKYGHVAGASSFAVKIATGFYANRMVGLPVNNGLVLTLDAHTGMPLSLILDEGWLTAWRTAAAVMLAATRLAPNEASTFGVVGGGLQASLALEWIGWLRPEWPRIVWARDAAQAKRLGARFAATSAVTLDALIADSDIVVTTTPASTPLFAAKSVRGRQLYIGAGADGPGKHELPTDLFSRAAWVVVDDKAQCLDHGDWGAAVRAGRSSSNEACFLGDVLARNIVLEWEDGAVGVVDLTGIAAEDIAVAALFTNLLAEATERDAHG